MCVCVCVCVSRDEREVRGQVWWILPVLVVWLLVFMSQKARRLLTYNGNCNLGLTRTWSHKKSQVQEGEQIKRNQSSPEDFVTGKLQRI